MDAEGDFPGDILLHWRLVAFADQTLTERFQFRDAVVLDGDGELVLSGSREERHLVAALIAEEVRYIDENSVCGVVAEFLDDFLEVIDLDDHVEQALAGVLVLGDVLQVFLELVLVVDPGEWIGCDS